MTLRDQRVNVNAELRPEDGKILVFIAVTNRRGQAIVNLTREETALICREASKRSKEKTK